MGRRGWLLSSTFLAGFALAATGAFAADYTMPAPSLRAVDGTNGKIEAFGGGYASKGFAGAAGSLSTPIGVEYGAQLDVGAGTFANRFLGAVGGHLFWRNPQKGLLGVYGDYAHWDQFGGVHVGHVGAEGEAYLGRWSVGGVVGAEFGNNTAGVTTGPIPGGGIMTTTALNEQTRFFDRVTLSYYLTDNWKASIGHRYMGGRNAASLGTEYAMPASRGIMASLFAEGRAGEGHNNYGVWGGLRVYFGNSDKSLIRRHREDDPVNDFSADTLFNIVNSNIGQSPNCFGETFLNGNCIVPP